MIYYYFYNPKIELAGIGSVVDFESKILKAESSKQLAALAAVERPSLAARTKNVIYAAERFSFKRSERK